MSSDDVDKMRGRMVTGLYLLSTLLNLGAFACVFLICLAGTMGISEDLPFILPDLAIATFNGIQPAGDGSFTVKLTWFLNALGWQDSSGSGSGSNARAGLVYNIQGTTPGDMLTLPKHLIYVARRMGMDNSNWQCLRHGSGSGPGLLGGFCSPFFAAWFAAPERVFSTETALYACFAALPLLLVASLIRSLYVGAAASAALLLTAASVTLVGYRLVAHLDDTGIDGIHAEMSGRFLLVVWGAVGLSLVANLAVFWGQHLGRSASSWMEDKMYREEIEALVDAAYAAAEEEEEEGGGGDNVDDRAVVEHSDGAVDQNERMILAKKQAEASGQDLKMAVREENLVDLD